MGEGEGMQEATWMQSPPLSNSLPRRGERKKQIPLFPIFLFSLFLKMGDFIYAKKVKQKNLLYIL